MSTCPVCAADIATGTSRCGKCGASLTTRIANQPREMPRQHPTTTFIRRGDGTASATGRAAAPSATGRVYPPQRSVAGPLLVGLIVLLAGAGAVVWFLRPDVRTVELGHGFTATLPPSWIETPETGDQGGGVGIAKRFTCVHDKVRLQTQVIDDVKEGFTGDKLRQLLVLQMRKADAQIGPNDVIDRSHDGLARFEMTAIDRKALVAAPGTLAQDDYKRLTAGFILDATGKRLLEYMVAFDDETDELLRVCASIGLAAP